MEMNGTTLSLVLLLIFLMAILPDSVEASLNCSHPILNHFTSPDHHNSDTGSLKRWTFALNRSGNITFQISLFPSTLSIVASTFPTGNTRAG
jgi:hypothetical protein